MRAERPRSETGEGIGIDSRAGDALRRGVALDAAEARRVLAEDRPYRRPSEDELAEHVSGAAARAVADAELHRGEIVASGGDPDALIEVFRRFSAFDRFEVKPMRTLRHWEEVRAELEGAGMRDIGDLNVVVIDDPEYWRVMHGSNPSKSSVELRTILLRKDLFESADAGPEMLSWLVHEIGHVAAYDALGEDAGRVMEETSRNGRYADTPVESVAFQAQVGYLRNTGMTKEECADFFRRYLEESSGGEASRDAARREFLEKESAQLARYVDAAFEERTE